MKLTAAKLRANTLAAKAETTAIAVKVAKSNADEADRRASRAIQLAAHTEEAYRRATTRAEAVAIAARVSASIAADEAADEAAPVQAAPVQAAEAAEPVQTPRIQAENARIHSEQIASNQADDDCRALQAIQAASLRAQTAAENNARAAAACVAAQTDDFGPDYAAQVAVVQLTQTPWLEAATAQKKYYQAKEALNLLRIVRDEAAAAHDQALARLKRHADTGHLQSTKST